MLLGTDNFHLIYLQDEVTGAEPYVRLCRLGWTAVGRVNNDDVAAMYNATLYHTFRSLQISRSTSETEETEDFHRILKRFWDLETMGILPTGRTTMTLVKS